MTGENFHHLSNALSVPLHSPNSRRMSAVSAVQGDCERVYCPPRGGPCVILTRPPGRPRNPLSGYRWHVRGQKVRVINSTRTINMRALHLRTRVVPTLKLAVREFNVLMINQIIICMIYILFIIAQHHKPICEPIRPINQYMYQTLTGKGASVHSLFHQ